jgi:serine/threonine protein kinase
MGGMGAVYQAWDSELGVAVAIKVVLPGVANDPEAAAEVEGRFKRELLLARQVTHKNVVRIHDLGEIDGIKYITMSYVEGSDLASILKQEGRLPVARVLAIARPVASGLAAAHAEGVVHRDLKPANIMIKKNGDALIMDFGIARSTGRGLAEKISGLNAPPGALPSQASFNRTMVGTVVGTLEYMAPEQARAQDVDQRADIYSFGLILYDMLVGRPRAERATSAIAELQARMQQPPPSVKTSVPEIPEPLERLVMRCLEPDRDKRFATTAELVAAMDRLDDKGGLIPVARRITRRGVAVTPRW